MPRYRKFTLAVAAVAVIFLVIRFFADLSFSVFCVIGIAAMVWLTTVSILAFIPCSGFYIKVLCKGTTNEKVVAITFDDGPDPQQTPVLAEVLKRMDVPATFFLIGSRIAGNEALLINLHNDGHLLGNHSFGHEPWFDLLPSEKMADGISETNRQIRNVIGQNPRMFRPPFGVTNPLVKRAVRQAGMVPVGWNIRSFDTLNSNPEVTLKRILKRLSPGSVILLHDHSRFSASHIEALITAIRNQGFTIVPLDKILNIKCYE